MTTATTLERVVIRFAGDPAMVFKRLVINLVWLRLLPVTTLRRYLTFQPKFVPQLAPSMVCLVSRCSFGRYVDRWRCTGRPGGL